MAGAVNAGTARLAIIPDTDNLGKDLDREIPDKVDKIGKKSGSIFSSAFSAIAAAQIGSQILSNVPALVTLGNTVQGYGIKAKAVFGDSLGDVQKWADGNAHALGLTRNELLGTAGSFGDLLKPMGFTEKQAADLTTKTLGLAGALAAWSGGQYDAAQVTDILSDAMLGNTDRLKSLGIDLSAAEIKQQLVADGTDKATGAALEQAKAVAAQELIFAKSTDAQAAWASGAYDAQKRQNELKASADELRERIATGLLPIFNAVAGFLVNDVGPAFLAVTGFVASHKDTFIALTAVVGTLFAVQQLHAVFLKVEAAESLAAYVAQINFVQIATKTWAAVQWLLNAAMDALPIIAIIAGLAALVAGIVWAYQNVGWFRDSVDAVAGAFVWFWHNVLEPIGDWLSRDFVDHLELVGRVLLAVFTFGLSEAVIAVWHHFGDIKDFIAGLPGDIGRIVSGMWDKLGDGLEAVVRWIKNELDKILGPLKDIGDKIGDIGHGIGGALSHIPGFADGGVVPGGIGQSTLIKAHGGEVVLPTWKMSVSDALASTLGLHTLQPSSGDGGGPSKSYTLNLNGSYDDANVTEQFRRMELLDNTLTLAGVM